MHAFRSSHAARDAKVKHDVRTADGERVVTGRRTLSRSPVTDAVLRREVAIDLEALMNTIALESTDDLSEFKYVRKSILNFGLPDVSSRTLEDEGVQGIGKEIEEALFNYEPRLDRKSVSARRDDSIGYEQLKLRFVVKADLRCEPVNIPVEFVADLDLQSGAIQLNRL
ncbi:MAG: type VI secretion system baseplate subunit TssE [Proteobacteria bacterium]|nr:type VI secretion system baseplate subunit TssE [Pseudomonadota bacterium]